MYHVFLKTLLVYISSVIEIIRDSNLLYVYSIVHSHHYAVLALFHCRFIMTEYIRFETYAVSKNNFQGIS